MPTSTCHTVPLYFFYLQLQRETDFDQFDTMMPVLQGNF